MTNYDRTKKLIAELLGCEHFLPWDVQEVLIRVQLARVGQWLEEQEFAESIIPEMIDDINLLFSINWAYFQMKEIVLDRTTVRREDREDERPDCNRQGTE